MAIRNRPKLTRRHAEEISKLAATGLQNLALLLLGALLLQPMVNAALTPPGWLVIVGILISSAAELSAMLLLRYIPFTPDQRDKAP